MGGSSSPCLMLWMIKPPKGVPRTPAMDIMPLFAGCGGMKLEAGEGHQRKMDEAAFHTTAGSEKFEEYVAKELECFGFTGFKREVSPFAGDKGGELLKINIAFEKERVALELDGPFLFLKSCREKQEVEPSMRGKAKAKTRLMESLGWKVMRFSWLENIEYEKMKEEKRREFWRKALGELGVKDGVKLTGEKNVQHEVAQEDLSAQNVHVKTEESDGSLPEGRVKVEENNQSIESIEIEIKAEEEGLEIKSEFKDQEEEGLGSKGKNMTVDKINIKVESVDSDGDDSIFISKTKEEEEDSDSDDSIFVSKSS